MTKPINRMVLWVLESDGRRIVGSAEEVSQKLGFNIPSASLYKCVSMNRKYKRKWNVTKVVSDTEWIAKKDGSIVLRGSITDVMRKVHTSFGRMRMVANTGKEVNGYTIETEDITNIPHDEYDAIIKSRENDKDEENYQMIKKHILIYGNTSTMLDAGPIVKRLESEGINVKCHDCTYRWDDGRGIVTKVSHVITTY